MERRPRYVTLEGSQARRRSPIVEPPTEGGIMIGQPGKLARGVLGLGERLPEGPLRDAAQIVGGNLPHQFPKRRA